MFCLGSLKETSKKFMKESQLQQNQQQQEQQQQQQQFQGNSLNKQSVHQIPSSLQNSRIPPQSVDVFKGSWRVKLKRNTPAQEFGIDFITAGPSNQTRVVGIQSNSPADLNDGLDLGDLITSIDGRPVSSLNPLEIHKLLKGKNETLTLNLTLDYYLPFPNNPQFSVLKKKIEVKLQRRENELLGLTIRGGREDNFQVPFTISKIKKGGVAERDGTAKVGDRLLSVNQISLQDKTLEQAVACIYKGQSSSASNLRYGSRDSMVEDLLLVEYDVSIIDVVQNASGPLLVEIDKQPIDRLGLTLSEGQFRGHRVMYISMIERGSIADRCGALHHGDHVLAVDGEGLEEMEVEEANQKLRNKRGFQVQLEIVPAQLVLHQTSYTKIESVKDLSSSPSPSSSSKHPPSQDYDELSLQNQIYVNHPLQQLPQQQQLLNTQFNNINHQPHCKYFQKQNSRDTSLQNSLTLQHQQQLQLEQGHILGSSSLPKHHQFPFSSGPSLFYPPAFYNPRQLTQNKSFSLDSDESTVNENSDYSKLTNPEAAVAAAAADLSSASMTSLTTQDTYNSMTTQMGSAVMPPLSHLMPGRRGLRSKFGCQPFRSIPPTQICHVDMVEVLLVASDNYKRFGLRLEERPVRREGKGLERDGGGETFIMDPPIISYIESRSPAERCGVLQEGDRILSINGHFLGGQRPGEASELLAGTEKRLLLLIEFDVAESIVPSSGVFIVKLAKRSSGLGVTISCPKNRKPGQLLVITNVKKGSVAHRTGSIQPGDKLLAIDNVRLDDVNLSLEDSGRVLRETQDIVKLTIQKDENFADEPDPTHLITYTVELPKFAGPVGITISGSEEPFDPIFISSLLPGGMAQRTGTLHVGDRLLAINGTSLRGKTLTDAVHLLQNAGHTVTLKITRLAKTTSETLVTPQDRSISNPCNPSNLCDSNNHYIDNLYSFLDNPKSKLNESVAMTTTTESGIEEKFENVKIEKESEESEIKETKETTKGITLKDQQQHLIPVLEKINLKNLEKAPRRELHLGSMDSALESWGSSGVEGQGGMGMTRVSCPPSLKLKPTSQHYYKNYQINTMKSPIIKENEEKLSQFNNLKLTKNENEEEEEEMESYSDLPDVVEEDQTSFLFPSLIQPSPSSPYSVPIKNLNKLRKLSEEDLEPGKKGNERTKVTPSSEDCAQLKEVEEQLDNIFTPTPLEILKLTLSKENHPDFGFSLSDGVFEKGVYVGAVRPGGPAQLKLKPFDRILQVGSKKTRDMDCGEVVKLIKGNKIELVISRNPLVNMSKSELSGKSGPTSPCFSSSSSEVCKLQRKEKSQSSFSSPRESIIEQKVNDMLPRTKSSGENIEKPVLVKNFLNSGPDYSQEKCSQHHNHHHHHHHHHQQQQQIQHHHCFMQQGRPLSQLHPLTPCQITEEIRKAGTIKNKSNSKFKTSAIKQTKSE